MIRLKELLKMYGTMLLSFGSITVTTAFLNFYLDLKAMEIPENQQLQIIYDGQLSMSKIIVGCAGGILGLITLIVLFFSISHYISGNEANMGVLKALGYSERKIALQFFKYGIPVFTGTLLGYLAGMLLASPLYKSMSEIKEITPDVSFNPLVPLLLIVVPSASFAVFSSIFAYVKLQKEPLAMIKGIQKVKISGRISRSQNKGKEYSFLAGLKRNMRISHPILYLFVGIAAWGFSAMIQMSFTMVEAKMSNLAPAIAAPVGVMMGFISLILAINFVLSINRPYISLMKAYGYSDTECSHTLLNGYRPAAAIGFVIGTLYQYFLMKFASSLFAGAYDINVPFSVKGLIITLAVFAVYYEGVMWFYKKKITSIPLREAMVE